jgi:hypothetical protein
MKSFLPLPLLLVLVARSSADTVPSNCLPNNSSGAPIEVAANSQYLALLCPFVPGSSGTDLYIAGPKGVETFAFRFVWDRTRGSLFLNDLGEVIGAGEATADPFIFFAIYGFGGHPQPLGGFGNGNGFLPGSPIQGDFGSLGWSPIPPPAPPGIVLVRSDVVPTTTGLSDQGIATGTLTWGCEGSDCHFVEPLSWDLGILRPVPEPASLLLTGIGLFILVAAKRIGSPRCL